MPFGLRSLHFGWAPAWRYLAQGAEIQAKDTLWSHAGSGRLSLPELGPSVLVNSSCVYDFFFFFATNIDTYLCWLVQLSCQLACLSKTTRMPEGCFLGLGRCHRESLEPWIWTTLVRQQPTGWRCDLQTDRVKIRRSPWCFPTGRLCCMRTEATWIHVAPFGWDFKI